MGKIMTYIVEENTSFDIDTEDDLEGAIQGVITP
jgi:hypothetical protein